MCAVVLKTQRKNDLGTVIRRTTTRNLVNEGTEFASFNQIEHATCASFLRFCLKLVEFIMAS